LLLGLHRDGNAGILSVEKSPPRVRAMSRRSLILLGALIFLLSFTSPLSSVGADKRTEKEESERDKRVAKEFALLSRHQKQVVLETAWRLTDEKKQAVNLRVLDRYWLYFDNEKCRPGVLRLVDRKMFGEFCDNLGLPKEGRTDELAIRFLLAKANGEAHPSNSRMAVAVSRAYKEKGLGNLPAGHMEFVKENRKLFANILDP
jgi:hypothetical protein